MDLSTIIQFLLRTLIDKDMILCLAFASSLVREISCKVLETQVHHCGFCIVVQLIHRPMKREHTNKQFKTYGFCQSQLILLHQRKRAKGAFYRRPSVHCIASLPCPFACTCRRHPVRFVRSLYRRSRSVLRSLHQKKTGDCQILCYLLNLLRSKLLCCL